MADELTPHEVKAWRELVEQLTSIQRFVQRDDIRAYQIWGPQVARFSFMLSPFVAGNPELETAAPVELADSHRGRRAGGGLDGGDG